MKMTVPAVAKMKLAAKRIKDVVAVRQECIKKLEARPHRSRSPVAAAQTRGRSPTRREHSRPRKDTSTAAVAASAGADTSAVAAADTHQKSQ